VHAAPQIAFGAFALAEPVVGAREAPQDIRRRVARAIFGDEALGSCAALFFAERIRLFAAQPERFEQALFGRGDRNGEFADRIADDRLVERWLGRCPGLDDLQRAQAGALVAPSAQEQASVFASR
jgi:hypothetical protein